MCSILTCYVGKSGYLRRRSDVVGIDLIELADVIQNSRKLCLEFFNVCVGDGDARENGNVLNLLFGEFHFQSVTIRRPTGNSPLTLFSSFRD